MNFIIGVDAFSSPHDESAKEVIVHTAYPRFIAEITNMADDGISHKIGFSSESVKIIWCEECEKSDLLLAIREAEKAIEYYTKSSFELFTD